MWWKGHVSWSQRANHTSGGATDNTGLEAWSITEPNKVVTGETWFAFAPPV